MGNKKSKATPAALAALVVVLGGALAASLVLLSPAGGETAGGGDQSPATVEHVEGSDVARVRLTERAAERVDIHTDEIGQARVGNGTGLVMPYGALLYDAQGGTWTYTSPEPLLFVRAAVTVDAIKGDQVFLTKGPPAGTSVVTVGATELLGAEFGVGH